MSSDESDRASMDSIDVSLFNEHTFRFSSGQTLTLEEHQVQKIPYLVALISAADHLESVCDEHGHYKLDPLIEFQHFSFVLQSLSSTTTRQLFTQMPKSTDCIVMLDLLDFLGLLPNPAPTLNEVDASFFSTLIYSPMLKLYLQSIREAMIQDTAVDFAIALATDQYDLTKCEVLDQIHWFLVFILGANKLFDDHLRYHVYQIARDRLPMCQLPGLKPLHEAVNRELAHSSDTVFGPMTLLDCWEMEAGWLNEDDLRSSREIWRGTRSMCKMFFDLTSNIQRRQMDLTGNIRRRQNLLLRQSSPSSVVHTWAISYKVPTEGDLLRPVHARVLEIMYQRLLHEICQRARTHRSARLRDAVQNANYEARFRLFFQRSADRIILSPYLLRGNEDDNNNNSNGVEMKRIWTSAVFDDRNVHKHIQERVLSEILTRPDVSAEIHEHIREGLGALALDLTRKYHDLVGQIQIISGTQNASHRYSSFQFFLTYPRPSFEQLQEEALCYELLLEKIYRGFPVADELYRNVLTSLYDVATKQIVEWEMTQIEIDQLRQELSERCRREKNPLITSKPKYERRQISRNKPPPKPRIKCSKHR